MTLNTFFSAILNMSLTGSLVILAVMAMRLLLKKAPKIFSYVLWLVVLFRLLCPVSLVSEFSMIPDRIAPAPVSDAPVSQLQYWVNPESEALTQAAEQDSEPENPAFTLEKPASVSPSFRAMEILSWIWLCGLAVMIAQSGWSFCKLRRKLKESVRYRGNIYLADDIPTPFVMGLIHPNIYLPSYLSKGEQKYIIAHERQHIRRCDQIFKFLSYLALSLHWFNPLAWAAFLLSSRDMEMSCDEAVIRKLGPEIRADYSASLLRLATGHRIIAGVPLAFGEGDTKGRVKNMANWKKPKKLVLISCIIACLLILAACGMNPKSEPIETEPTIPETAEAVTEAVTEGTEPHMIDMPQSDTIPAPLDLQAKLLKSSQTGASVEIQPPEEGSYEAYFRIYGVEGNLNYALPQIGGEYPVFSGKTQGSPLRIDLDWKDYWGILSPGKYLLSCSFRLGDSLISSTQFPFQIGTAAIPIPKEQEAARTCLRELSSQLVKNKQHYRLRSPEGFTVELWQDRDQYKVMTTFDSDYDGSQNPKDFYITQNFVSCMGYSYIGIHQDPEDYTSPVIGWELYGPEVPMSSSVVQRDAIHSVFPSTGEIPQFEDGGYIRPGEIHFYTGRDTEDPDKEYYEHTYFFDEGGNLTRAESFFHMPWEDGKEYYDEPVVLEFFPDTDQQIRQGIQNFRKDLKVQTFSWAEAQKIQETANRTVNTSDFQNTSYTEDTNTPEDAVRRASRELPFTEPMYGGIRVAYDPRAEMWRVTFEHPSLNQKHAGLFERRDVYISTDGIPKKLIFEDHISMEDRMTK